MLHGNVMLCDANRRVWMHLRTLQQVVHWHQTWQVQTDVINHVMVWYDVTEKYGRCDQIAFFHG